MKIRVFRLFLLLAFVHLGVWTVEAQSLPMSLELREIDGRPTPYQSGQPMISFDPQERPRLDLAGAWTKRRLAVNHDFSLRERNAQWLIDVESETGGATQPGFDDSSWDLHQAPGVENEMPATPEDPVGAEIYAGGIYYRRSIDVPAEWAGRTVRLVCLGADYVADVWINGQWVGYHEGGYAPFALDVGAALIYGGENLVVFRVDAMPWSIRLDILPSWFATDWMHYVGIVQDVYLEAAPPVHVVRADVLPENKHGDLDVSVLVRNDRTTLIDVEVRTEAFVLDASQANYLTDPVAAHLLGEAVELSGDSVEEVDIAAQGVKRLSFAVGIENPRLWTPAEPNLYALRVTVSRGGQALDTFTTQFGVRTVEVGDEAKVLLNRRPAFFTGMARHEDWPDSGRTATTEKILADLQIIRDTNVRLLRTAHYPNHPDTYLLTDRLGFAVWEEIPAWWLMQLNIPVLLARGLPQQMWREMIFNGRNRPSILFWSLCNEPMWYLAFNLRDYIRTLHADLDENFPDGRLVTQSLAADGALITADEQPEVDVAGWTMYFGVFYGEDILGESVDFLERQHRRFPALPIIVTEFGYWSGSDGGEEARQVEVAEDCLDAFLPLAAVDEYGATTDGFLAGATWWCQFNWYRVQDPHNQTMGIMHMDRATTKPVYDTLVARYENHFAMGGLGAPVPGDDDTPDDDTADDDATDDDATDDDTTDDDTADDDDDDDDDDGCGC